MFVSALDRTEIIDYSISVFSFLKVERDMAKHGMFISRFGRVRGITKKTIIFINGNNAHVGDLSKEQVALFIRDTLKEDSKLPNKRLRERIRRLNPSLVFQLV